MDVMLPKSYGEIFVTISACFRLFSLCLPCPLELSTHSLSMWSTPNCGRICGQKRFPPKPAIIHRPRAGSVLCFSLIGL